MNFHDSEKMAGILAGEGLEEAPAKEMADIVIFNTCSIREKAEQKFFSELGKLKVLKKSRPDLKIAVAGCIAQQAGAEILKKAPYIDFILGPQNLHSISHVGTLVASSDTKKNLHPGPGPERPVLIETGTNPYLAETDLPADRKDRFRAWISIMYGCNNFCSYCIVPYTRGREVSRPSESVLNEIRRLAEAGYREVTLLGQNVNSYRSDTDFPGLLRKISAINGFLERIRFVTSHPRDLSDELIACMKEPGGKKICEHIHLPLQSGSDSILGAMNRGYTYKIYREKVENLRRAVPGIAITTDIIAGFPGESEEDHMDTMRALAEIEYDGIFAFRYSPRPGTKAERMDGHLPDDVKARRLDEILALQDGITLKKNKALEGTVQEILVEGPSEKDEKKLSGRTRTNKIVNFYGDVPAGNIINVRIKKAKRHSLEAELI